MTKGLIIEKNGMNYSFKTDGKKTSLFYAKNGGWAVGTAGKRALLCYDDLNCGYEITIGAQTITLDVSELAEIGYLIQVIKAVKPNTFNKIQVAICQKQR